MRIDTRVQYALSRGFSVSIKQSFIHLFFKLVLSISNLVLSGFPFPLYIYHAVPPKTRYTGINSSKSKPAKIERIITKSFETTVLTCIAKLIVCRFSRQLQEEPDSPITSTTVKTQLMIAVRQLLGIEGASHQVDILKYNSSERKFILRCDSDSYVRLRAALTLANQFEGQPCSYTVHKASPNLLSFSADSRTYKH